MDKELAYTVARSLATSGEEHRIEEALKSCPEHLEYVMNKLRTNLAEPGPADILSDVDAPFWYNNDYFQDAKHWPRYRSLVEKKPKVATKKELEENFSSRSAKLRYAIKKSDFYNFKTDIFEKFEHLIEIENLDHKL